MNLQVTNANGKELGSRAAITNVLTNMKPIVSQITDDRKSWYGKNLVFDSIRVGNSSPVRVDCYQTEVSAGVMATTDKAPASCIMWQIRA
jgi:hypothetical protein